MQQLLNHQLLVMQSCNSPYRLRYAPKGARQQRCRSTMRAAHFLPESSEGDEEVVLIVYGIETRIHIDLYHYVQ